MPTEISNYSAIVQRWKYTHRAMGVLGINSWLSWVEMEVGKSKGRLPRGGRQLNMYLQFIVRSGIRDTCTRYVT